MSPIIGSFLEIISETCDLNNDVNDDNDLMEQVDDKAHGPQYLSSSTNASVASSSSSFRPRSQSQAVPLAATPASLTESTLSLSVSKAPPKRRKSLAKIFSRNRGKKSDTVRSDCRYNCFLFAEILE